MLPQKDTGSNQVGLEANGRNNIEPATTTCGGETMKPRWSTKILATLLCAGLAGISFGQSTNSGDIRGVVTDSTGAAIPGVTVTVTNVNTGISNVYTTNNDGVYDTSSIVAGTYKISFSKSGFSELVRPSVTLNAENTTVNAQLAIGAVSEQVVVNMDVPLLKTENGEQTFMLDAQTLSQLPQVGQDWSSFDILIPGAAGAPQGNQGALGTGTSNGTMLAVTGILP